MAHYHAREWVWRMWGSIEDCEEVVARDIYTHAVKLLADWPRATLDDATSVSLAYLKSRRDKILQVLARHDNDIGSLAEHREEFSGPVDIPSNTPELHFAIEELLYPCADIFPLNFEDNYHRLRLLGRLCFGIYLESVEYSTGIANAAIFLFEEALALGHPDQTEKISTLCELGEVLLRKTVRECLPSDAERSEKTFCRALQLEPANSRAISGLVQIKIIQYKFTGTPTLLYDALELTEFGISCAADTNPYLQDMLQNAGALCLLRMTTCGSATAFDEAGQLHQTHEEPQQAAANDIDLAMEFFLVAQSLVPRLSKDAWNILCQICIALRLRFTVFEEPLDLLASWLCGELAGRQTGLSSWEFMFADVTLRETLLQVYFWTSHSTLLDFLTSPSQGGQVLLEEELCLRDRLVRESAIYQSRIPGHESRLPQLLALARGQLNVVSSCAEKWGSKLFAGGLIMLVSACYQELWAKYLNDSDLEAGIRHLNEAIQLFSENGFYAHLRSHYWRQGWMLGMVQPDGWAEKTYKLWAKGLLQPRSYVKAIRRSELLFFCPIVLWLFGLDKSEAGIDALLKILDNELYCSKKLLFHHVAFQRSKSEFYKLKADLVGTPMECMQSAWNSLCIAKRLAAQYGDKTATVDQACKDVQLIMYHLAEHGTTAKKNAARMAWGLTKKVYWNADFNYAVRAQAALETGVIAMNHFKDLKAAAYHASLAVFFFRIATTEGLSRKMQLELIKLMSTSPELAAALMIFSKQYTLSTAFAFYDWSRSTLWGRLVFTLEEMEGVGGDQPAAAMKIENLMRRMSSSQQQAGPLSVYTMGRTFYGIELAKAMHELKLVSGYERFDQLDTSPDGLESYSKLGPIVVCTGTVKVLAMILANGKLSCLILTKCSDSAIAEIRASLRDACQKLKQEETKQEGCAQINKVLKWLWTNAAKPILDSLGFDGSPSPGKELPRIWWVSGGAFKDLPIHAAGDHDAVSATGMPENVMDRAVSSYIPTVKYLVHARNRLEKLQTSARLDPEVARASLFSLERTPATTNDRFPQLPRAHDEARQVREILHSHYIVDHFTELVSETRATVPAAVSSLQKSTICHFSCHGKVNQQDPLKSAICLYEGHLTVERLRKVDVQKCQLAYLSLCESATVRADKFMHETLHVAGGLLMAGVPIVISTLWEIYDYLSVDVAVGFYKNLIDEDYHVNPAQAARALHASLRKLRDEGESVGPLAPFVHFGV